LEEGFLQRQDTKKTIDEQIKKLEYVKEELNDNLERAGEEFMRVINEAQEKEGKG
jgi:prefoldin subunit 5